jgi:uncharacterized protein (DUF2345 family)
MIDFFGISEGYVKDTEDPDQMGRLKIWCPAYDGEQYDVDALQWAEYATPFGGVTNDFPAGRESEGNDGPVSYGFWGIPKIGAKVYIFHVNGDPNRRCYFASGFGLHRNRSLPAGRNINPNVNPIPTGPYTDSYDPIEPAYKNLRTQFGGEMSKSEAKTRGAYERQMAQDTTEKDGSEGYAKSPVDHESLDPQGYCWVTPGHHMIIMNDTPEHCRVRIKTCAGHQILLDDSNERIYISSAKGRNYIELDEDGRIHVFGEGDIGIRAGGNLDLSADGSVNIEAGKDVNIKATKGSIKAQADSEVAIRAEGGNIDLTACKDMNLNVQMTLFQTANESHIKSESGMYIESSGGDMNIKSSSGVNIGGEGGVSLSGESVVLKGGSVNMNSAGGSVNLGGDSATIGGKNVSVVSASGQHGFVPFSSAGSVPNQAEPSKPATANQASNASFAGSPSVVPNQEPWVRASSKKTRNKNWKP